MPSSSRSSATFVLHGPMQSTPRTTPPSSPEITYLGTRFNPYRRGANVECLITTPDNQVVRNQAARPAIPQGFNRHNGTGPPPLVIDLTSSPTDRRKPPVVIDLTLSPQAQRELERVEECIRLRESKRALRRIIKVIQDKRREDFRVLREALYQVYSYTGPYLQRPGEKEAAAHLLRTGGLGAQFVNDFDNVAKWEWLQIRVNAM